MQRGNGLAAVAALALIFVITAAWWALALWPLPSTGAEWLARTRLACFGAAGNDLPDGGGWLLLIGQPMGMLIMLFAVWGDETRAGLRGLLQRTAGQITAGVGMAVLLFGAAGVFVRVTDAGARSFDPLPDLMSSPAALTRVNDVPPALSLVDQNGDTVTLGTYHGRAVLVTFAFAHCETVCPLVVHDALAARSRIAERSPERAPVVLVVTLDPWRDTPSRLPAMARQWGMTGDAHVLSGPPDVVERTLNAWRIPRVRNEKTGDISHPALVYVIGPNGRITYVVPGATEQIIAAIASL
jgi:cytochrome oxidase Cu insertion factor (SCO1/SenC/PrrC family)